MIFELSGIRRFNAVRSINLPPVFLPGLVLLVFCCSAIAQSGDSAEGSENPVVEELEKNLETEREELDGALEDREAMLAEQAGIRDQLAEEERVLEEKLKALMELCEQHNSLNQSNPIDCESEISGISGNN